ncbi:hypothetical protein P2318_21545 [Myxococcaceae bacterium GXIMD 01537]
MAKKVLIGLGIGCGVLVLLGVIGVGVTAYFAKKALGGAIEASKQTQAQETELQELNKTFAFTPPADGEVLALQEARLNDYFAVRDSALPVFKEFEAKAAKYNDFKDGPDGKGAQPSVSDALEAGTIMIEILPKVRGAYIEGLKQHRMSPVEFTSITGAIYNSYIADSANQFDEATENQREGLESGLAELRQQLEDPELSEEVRANLKEQEATLQTQLDGLAEVEKKGLGIKVSEKARDVAAANLKLLEKFKDRIENGQNPAFDALVATGNNPFATVGQGREEYE